jgi:hypothetical protein
MRHNHAVLASWDELIEKVGPRPGMWVGDRYSLVRSFVTGFGAAQDDDVLDRFQQWLSVQPQHHAIKNWTWSSLLLHEAFPERDRPWDGNPAAPDSEWPAPPPTPVGESDLVYPEDDEIAIAHLFDRLREYLDLRSAAG